MPVTNPPSPSATPPEPSVATAFKAAAPKLKSLLTSAAVLPSIDVPSTLKKSLSATLALATNTFPSDIPDANPFTNARLVTSESINAPAAVTFAVSVTSALLSTESNLVSWASVISLLLLASVKLAVENVGDAPLITDWSNAFTSAILVSSLSINAPAAVTLLALIVFAVAPASPAGKPIDSHSPDVIWSAVAEAAIYILLLSSESNHKSPTVLAVGTLAWKNNLPVVAPSSGKVVVNNFPLPTTWVEAILAFFTSASPNVVEPSAALRLVPNLAPTVALSAGLVLLASWISSYSVFLLSNITSTGEPAVSWIVVVLEPSLTSSLPVEVFTLIAKLLDNALPAIVLVVGTLAAKSVSKSVTLDCANVGILAAANVPLPILSAGNVGIILALVAAINCVSVIFLLAEAVAS